jgi:hypothetical protein
VSSEQETQVFVVSTLYGLTTLAAAIDAGLFPVGDAPGVESRIRRLLVISDNVAVPEANPSVAEMVGAELLIKRFDQVVSYNETIAPFHPVTWSPRHIDGELWQRFLRQSWGIDSYDIHLIVESIQVEPAQAICRIFADARIDVYADGLMSYGPTRNLLDGVIGSRVERLLYPDLVPGLTPMLLSEWDVVPVIIPTESMKRVLAEVAGETDLTQVRTAIASATPRVAVLLGQYLSALEILTEEEESDLHLQMLYGAVTNGHRLVVFKPHPLAPQELADSLRTEAKLLGVRLVVLDEPALAETLYAQLPVALVIGCFSTAMITATSLYGIPAARVGTELILERLTPYQNSNRIPVTLVDLLIRPLGAPARPFGHDPVRLPELIIAVGYVMQPAIYQHRRGEAERFLAQHFDAYASYFRRLRLTRLSLPGALSDSVATRWRRRTNRMLDRLVAGVMSGRAAPPRSELPPRRRPG